MQPERLWDEVTPASQKAPINSWQKGKRLERRVAKVLGGRSAPMSGAVGGGDVWGSEYSVECKSRAKLPVLLKDALAQADRAAAATGNIKPSLVVLQETHGEVIYCLREADFIQLKESGGLERAWHVRNKLKDIIGLAKAAIEESG